MTARADTAVSSVSRSRFEEFLLASIGEDGNDSGMQLSVLSALARQNVDPWEEAASLSSVPSEMATQRLTSLIAALPKGRSTCPEPGVNAARLIALLPRAASPDVRSRMTLLRRGAGQTWTARQVTVYVIILAVILALQWFVATRPGAGPHHQASGPTRGIASSATELRNAGR